MLSAEGAWAGGRLVSAGDGSILVCLCLSDCVCVCVCVSLALSA